MTTLPLAARLSPLDEKIDAAETVRRIQSSTLRASIDWKEGDAEVQRGVERLQRMNVPDFYLDAKRKSFGKVAYVEVMDDNWPGETAWFYAGGIERNLGDCYDVCSGPPINIPFLIHVAENLSRQLGFRFLISTDCTWGIEMELEPEECDITAFIHRELPEHNYPEVSLCKLADWQASLLRAVPLWFEQATVRNKGEMIERLGSVQAVAKETVDALLEIGAVRTAWKVVVPAPFFNGLVLEQVGWTSFVGLRGAPTGILT